MPPPLPPLGDVGELQLVGEDGGEARPAPRGDAAAVEVLQLDLLQGDAGGGLEFSFIS